MIKITHLLLAGAVVLAVTNAGLAQVTGAQTSGGASSGIDQGPRAVDQGRAGAQSSGGASSGMAAVVNDVMAQDAGPEPLPGAPDTGVGSGVLEALPRPRDIPKSLFAPATPQAGPPLPIDTPYFYPDPLLDWAPFGAPGWFAGAEAQIVKPHLITDSAASVFPGKSINNAAGIYPLGGNSTTVKLPSAKLNWTAAPRVFAGYRLPSGFGEVMVGWQHLGTTGSGSVPDVGGPVSLNTRFAYDIIDIDYNSRELSLWDQWDMKWTFGLRQIFLFYDTQGAQSFGQAAGTNGIMFARQVNDMYGIGPHAAIELNRRFGTSGWSFYCRGDFSGSLDYVNQAWVTGSTTLDAKGHGTPGQTSQFGHQAAPIITGRAGLSWKPAPTSGTRLFIGYQYMSIWNLNILPQSNGTGFSPGSTGQFWSQGVVLQATFNY
jgi:hypothetical protein